MSNNTEQPEFWERHFSDKQEMWGMEPARSAIVAKDLFVREAIREVLVPGIGYGRNAQVFSDSGMAVTGIEISKTAIEIARKHYGTRMTIHHGSVTGMPFDDQMYDGIFCHALIHLLDENERRKLIRDCYQQLSPGGFMVFSVISKQAHTYGTGKPIGKDRFEQFGGVTMYFYDTDSIDEEFGDAGLIRVETIEENFPFLLITCQKPQL